MSEIRTPPKRLVDLSPVWLPSPGDEARYSLPRHYALELDCPCGLGEACHVKRLFIPIEGRAVSSVAWRVTSATDEFDALTLQPSVHAPGHWHGWITNGEVVSC